MTLRRVHIAVATVLACLGALMAPSCIYINGNGPMIIPSMIGPMTVDGPYTVNGSLTVNGPLVVHGTVKSRELHIAGGVYTTLPAHEASGPTGQSVSGPISISGLLTVHGSLTVNGSLTVAGPLTAEGFEP